MYQWSSKLHLSSLLAHWIAFSSILLCIILLVHLISRSCDAVGHMVLNRSVNIQLLYWRKCLSAKAASIFHNCTVLLIKTWHYLLSLLQGTVQSECFTPASLLYKKRTIGHNVLLKILKHHHLYLCDFITVSDSHTFLLLLISRGDQTHTICSQDIAL